MTQATCSHMAEVIQQQLHGQFKIVEHEDFCLIITPMWYPDNTQISVAFEVIDEQHFLLTDYGEAWGYAFVNGVPKEIIQDQMRDTVRRFHLSDTGSDELMLHVKQSEVGRGIFTLAQAIQDIGYLVYRRAPMPEEWLKRIGP